MVREQPQSPDYNLKIEFLNKRKGLLEEMADLRSMTENTQMRNIKK